MNQKQIGIKLKQLREKREETITDLALAIGVSERTINAYELGERSPRDKIKVALAEHFDVSVGFLFFE